jgi:hypothetical protein
MNTILRPLFAMVVNAVVPIVAFRSQRGIQFFRSIVVGFLAGAGMLAVIEIPFAAGSFSLRDYLVLVFLINIPIYPALSDCAESEFDIPE